MGVNTVGIQGDGKHQGNKTDLKEIKDDETEEAKCHVHMTISNRDSLNHGNRGEKRKLKLKEYY